MHLQLKRLVIYCQTTGVSAAHATHCATYCAPCRPLYERLPDGFELHLLPHLQLNTLETLESREVLSFDSPAFEKFLTGLKCPACLVKTYRTT